VESVIDDPPGIISAALALAPVRRPLVAGLVTNPMTTRLFVHPDRPSRSGRIASYRILKTPALVIWGAADSVTPLPQGKAIASLIASARLEVDPFSRR